MLYDPKGVEMIMFLKRIMLYPFKNCLFYFLHKPLQVAMMFSLKKGDMILFATAESVKRISSLDIEILMWNEIVTYLNKEHIVPKTRIFKKGNDIVIDCDR